MTTVTPADRSAAHWLAEELAEVLDDESGLWGGGVDVIANALAIARETERARFLAVAERLESALSVDGISHERSAAYEIAVRHIRRASEETE